ncbi:MAG: 2-oxopent-4-enoate hydratase [Bradyrhizobium sp.]|nr:2-oxopent-4-enoate hydratase [Bradyrhizobium sp.]
MTSQDELAARLREAYRGGAIGPLRDGLDATDANGAYVVQQINTDYWTASGRRVVGRKIGLTAAAVQAQLGVDQPDYGVLFDDMQVADGGMLDMARLLQPKAEAEIALILARDVDDRDAGRDAIIAAVDHACAAIEIVDSRIKDWKISFADTVADNGSSAAFVLGGEKHRLDGLDLWSCGMVLEVNGAIRSIGAGAACLGHPLDAAAWLARKLAAIGTPLRAGDIVLTGALGPMVSIAAGDTVCATIGGLGRCTFDSGAA